MLLFEVDPHADRDPGVFLTFAHSVRDGKGWKLLMDSDGQIRVPFKACATHQCTAGYGGGNPDAATLRSCADLVAKMQVQDHLFLSYYRQNHEYSTAVNLRIFREAYEKLLKNVAERPATTPEAAPRSSEHTVR